MEYMIIGTDKAGYVVQVAYCYSLEATAATLEKLIKLGYYKDLEAKRMH